MVDKNSTNSTLLRLRAICKSSLVDGSVMVEIPGCPIAQKRHRRRQLSDRRVIDFDPQVKEKLCVSEVMKYRPPHDLLKCDHFHVDFAFYLPYPKLTDENVSAIWTNKAISKPDLDNLVKFYLDCGNGILWTDDKKIVSSNIQKYYSENPRTVIKIYGYTMKIDPDAEQILSLFGPDSLNSLCNDIFNYLAYRHDNFGDCDTYSESMLPQTAMLLSKIADLYSSDLKRIAKKHPGYWLKSESKNAYSNGKTRC